MIYEYQCETCGARTEVMQKLTDAPLHKCAKCGGAEIVKMLSAPAFSFAGGGSYLTDFKSIAEHQ